MSTYTQDQLERYYDHVEFPPNWRSITSDEARSKKGLEFLQRLQRHQLTAVPFENLGQHYNKHVTPVPALSDPEDLFTKIVETGHGSGEGKPRGGRGGVCFENNILFGTVLRSLGFEVCSVGGRVNHGAYFTAWEHMINLVTIDGVKYAVDVGFGRAGQTQPLPLKGGHTLPQIEPAQARLVLKALPEHTDRSQRLWMYQYRHNEDAEWQDKYCFTETEFLPIDYEAMSILITFKRSSFFTHTLAIVRMVRGSEIGLSGSAADEIVGEISGTTGRVRRFIRGKEDRSVTFETEAQRLEVLRDWFGIELSQREQAGAAGTAVELANDE